MNTQNQGPEPVPPLTHIVRVTAYGDNRGVVLQERETIFGVAPRGFHRYNASVTMPLPDQFGRTPMTRVEVGLDPAPGSDLTTVEGRMAAVVEAMGRAPDLLNKEIDARVEKAEKDMIANQIRRGAAAGIPPR